MKVALNQSNLHNVLDKVAKVAKGSALPSLSYILLEAEREQLKVSANDLTVWVTKTIAAKVEAAGKICVPARLLADIVATLKSNEVVLETEGTNLVITTDTTRTAINTLPEEDFPTMREEIDGTNGLRLGAESVRYALQHVGHAVSNDQVRPVLTGVYLHTQDGKLVAVATDGYRLGEYTLEPTNHTVNLIIPAEATTQLLRLFGDYTGELNISYDKSLIKVSSDDTVVLSCLIDGVYPAYRGLIPTEYAYECTIVGHELAYALKTANLLAADDANTVELTLDGDKQVLTVEATSAERGTTKLELEGVVKGTDEIGTFSTFSIKVNARYLSDALSQFDGDDLTLQFVDSGKPILMQTEQQRQVVMPLKK
jgi:DNA polymerase III subunit beta